ncbi:MAG: enoyl-CoA hydratase/isomerase family protein [Nitriliruptorales bacterium]|nr:enoyl-CoA hydratase/isomerase family protein [Nitriliruptorales bacterium]
MGEYSTIRVEADVRGVATVTMDRPEVRNAFDDTLIAELAAAAGDLSSDDSVRVVVLTGAGRIFSAGADLNWMRSMKDWTFDQNVADSTRMNGMFRALYDLPKPLIGRINGHALGGGTGLTAVCDIAIAVDAATFGFTEVVLGLAPAVISPYVVRKVGRSFARAVFVTGERFDARRAREAGLVHEVTDSEGLDAAVAAAVDRCLAAGPNAAAAAKRLPDLALRPLDQAAADTVQVIAGLRVSDEGQEGMSAFFEKRPPSWMSPPAAD